MRRLALLLTLLATPLHAQGLAFGGLAQDASKPVEITADSLAVDQATGVATFTGHVVIGQGALRLSAGKVVVHYGQAQEISALEASGGVTLASATEAAEAQNARYDLTRREVVMTGNVLVTQGRSAISGETLTLDLDSGSGTMTGRVRSILNAGGR